MADRRKTQRVAVNTELNSPNLQVDRRFLDARGFEGNRRTARLLEQAFGLGQDILQDRAVQANVDGRERAILDRGAGAERNLDDDNEGYNAAWDQLDAEYDFNQIKKELPEALRGFNAEERTEEEVQEFLTQYMQSQFAGIEELGDSQYAKYLAPRLLELETQAIETHRTSQLQAIQEDQRSKIFANAKEQLATDGELDVKKLFARTSTFFEGDQRKRVFWDSVFALAKEAGDPSIIDSVPAGIGSVPTGVNDPKFQEELRRARAAAAATGASRASADQARLRKESQLRVRDLQFSLADAAARGEDVSDIVRQLQAEPESSFSSVTAALNFGTKLLDKSQEGRVNTPNATLAWAAVRNGDAGITDVMEALANGSLGYGTAAHEEAQRMLAAVKDQTEPGSPLAGVEATEGRKSLNRRYNAALGGPFGKLDPFMNRINIAANDRFNALLREGASPLQAEQVVVEEFDPMVEKYTIDPDRIGGVQSQGQFERAELVPTSALKDVASGRIPYGQAFGGLSQTSIRLRVQDEVANGNLTAAEMAVILQNL